MKGLLIKDNFESFLLKKNMLAWLFSSITIIIFMASMRNIYTYVLIVGVMLPMIGCSTLQYSMEQDEISKFNKILLTYPITKKEIIQAKYISGFAIIFAMNGIMGLITMLLYVYGYHALDITTGLYTWVSGLIFAFIMTAINYVGFFFLGNKKGTIMFIVMIASLAIGYVCLEFSFSIETLLSFGKMNLLIIGFLIAVLSMILSYFTSLKIYTKKCS